MRMYFASCSHCGKAFSAKKIDKRGNYCSKACKAKAYRIRKKQMEMSRRGVMDFDLYQDVKAIKERYGTGVERAMRDLMDTQGADALKQAIGILKQCLEIEAQFEEQWKLA